MLTRFLPRSITTQLTLLLAAVLVLVVVISLGVLVGEIRPQTSVGQLDARIDRLLGHVWRAGDLADRPLPLLLNEPMVDGDTVILTPRPQTERIADAVPMRRWAERFERALVNAGIEPLSVEAVHGYMPRRPRPPGAADPASGSPPRRGPPRRGPPQIASQDLVLSAELAPGVWINSLSAYNPNLIAQSAIWYTVPAALALGILLIWLFVRQAVRPIKELARAAESLGRGESVQPVQEEGPREVRHAAVAFNRMQDRLVRSLVTQRTIMRAVSHDLRTPLTELRIRAEDIPAEYGRDKIIATIDEMAEMTAETLDWAREASGNEPLAPVDISALVESIVDDFADMGRNVSCADTVPIVIECRRVALRRAIRNLIDNALAYGGGRTAVSVEADEAGATIHVDDEGPGIPEDRIADVLNPFVRLERSRSKAHGGIGLGLSIVQTIAETHGGSVRLANRPGGGLRASLILPRTPE